MRTLLLLIAAVALVVIGAVVATALPQLQADEPVAGTAASPPPIPVATATVVQRTLQVTEEFDGTLGYAGEGVIISGINGTYTVLPEEGDVLTLGDEIYEVDGKDSSYLMYGRRPAWRALDIDSSNGADVKQLEASLKSLGMTSRRFRPDGKFKPATRTAIRKWERKTDQPRDGEIDRGQVTFLPGDVRITQVVPELGAPARAGSVLARTTGTDLVVTLDLEADRRDIVSVGDGVSVEMPDGSFVAGMVTEIDTVATTAPGSSQASVGVTVELADDTATGDLDGAEVTVSLVRQTRPDVLTVPVDALIALREGGYALEIAEPNGERYLIAVDVGIFDDDGVEVTGDLSIGDQVVVPV